MRKPSAGGTRTSAPEPASIRTASPVRIDLLTELTERELVCSPHRGWSVGRREHRAEGHGAECLIAAGKKPPPPPHPPHPTPPRKPQDPTPRSPGTPPPP